MCIFISIYFFVYFILKSSFQNVPKVRVYFYQLRDKEKVISKENMHELCEFQGKFYSLFASELYLKYILCVIFFSTRFVFASIFFLEFSVIALYICPRQ